MDNLEIRIEHGQEAISIARAEGRDTSQWEQHLAKLEKAREDSINLREAKYKYLKGKVKELNRWCDTDLKLRMYSKMIASEGYAREEKKVDAAYLDSIIALPEFNRIADEFLEYQMREIG